MIRFYLAAKFGRRAEMEVYASEIEKGLPDWVCRAKWVYGGENGMTRKDISLLDLADIDNCEALILFTHPRTEPQPGGGRFVEFGYALAKGKRLIVIGNYENAFIHHPLVTVYPTVADFIADNEVR